MKHKNKIAIFFILIMLCFQIVPTHANGSNVNGYRTDYEISNISIEGNNMVIDGWYLVKDMHNMRVGNHDTYLKINGKRYENTHTNYIDMSDLYDSWTFGWCSDSTSNSNTCNYYYQDVGFRFKIPLSDLNSIVNANYEDTPILGFTSYVNGKSFEQTFIYFANTPSLTAGDYRYSFNSSLASANFTVKVDEGLVRQGMGSSSSYYTAGGYPVNYKMNARFNKVNQMVYYDRVMWLNVNTDWYYENGASGLRYYAYQGNTYSSWIPSNFVDYRGIPFTIKINKRPVITASDMTIWDGESIDLMKGVTGSDREDGNVTSKITVSGTVNNKVAGKYPITYTVTDSGGLSTTQKITVTVLYNNPPTITASDITILKDMYSKEVWMNIRLIDVIGNDVEDGDITSKVKIKGDNTDLSKIGIYQIEYEVADTLGKSTTKKVNVYVYDDKVSEQKVKKYIRSISKKYIDTLKSSSIWKESDLNNVLKNSMNSETPISTWKLTPKDVEKIKEFNKSHDYSAESNRLFMEQFSYLKKK